MQCELCRSEVVDVSQASIPMEKAARSASFLETLGEEYFDAYGIPANRALLAKLTDTLGGRVTLCEECQTRIGLAEPSPSAPPPEEAPSRGPADLRWALAHLSSTDPTEQMMAMEALLGGGAESIPPLLDWAQSFRGDRTPGLQVLGFLQAEAAAPVLVEVFLHGTVGERETAQHALAALGPRCLAALEAALDPVSGFGTVERQRLLRTVGGIGEPVVPLLCRHLEDPEPAVCHAALEALEMVPSPECVEPVAALLADRNKGVRKTATLVLGRTGDPRVVAELAAGVRDSAADVRTATAWALTRIGAPIPEELREEVRGCTVEGWLYGGLLQLCGVERDEMESLLAGRGLRLTLERPVAATAEERAAEARRLLDEGSRPEAVELLQKARQELPFDAGPLGLLALCQSQDKQWDQAAATLESLIALEPFAPRWHHNLGVTRFHLGQAPAALEQWRQALLLAPEHRGAREALGRVAAEPGRPVPTVCLAHPLLLAASRCTVCGVPLCRNCLFGEPATPHCERHVPPIAEEHRRLAAQLAQEAWGRYDASRRALQQMRATAASGREELVTGLAGQAVFLLALGAVSPLMVGATLVQAHQNFAASAEARRHLEEHLAASANGLYEALDYDPGCEAAAWLLWELGEFYSAQGFESALPRGQRWQVLETCARTNPAALGVRYQVQRATDRAHGLWEYFRRLSLGSPPAWDRITLEVIRIALGDGLSESVGTYLRALLPRLPRHSLARRQCLARVRGLDQAAAW